MAQNLKYVTRATTKVLQVLLENTESEVYGLEIVRESGLSTGTVYPILERLESLGWLDSVLESSNPSKLERPLRRYINLTSVGKKLAKRLVADSELKSTRIRDIDISVIRSNTMHVSDKLFKSYRSFKINNRYESAKVSQGLLSSRCYFEFEKSANETSPFFYIKLCELSDIGATEIKSMPQFSFLNGKEILPEVVMEKLVYNLKDETREGYGYLKIPISSSNQYNTIEILFERSVGNDIRFLSATNYECQNYELEVEFVKGAQYKIQCPSYYQSNSSSEGFVSPTLKSNNMINLNEASRVSKDLKISENGFSWNPGHIANDYIYSIELQQNRVCNNLSQ